MSAASFPVEIVSKTHDPAVSRSTRRFRSRARVTLRSATTADVGAIHALVNSHLAEGRLLPRSEQEITAHVHRFVVAIRRGDVVGCADLAPLGRTVAEVRSLVVQPDSRALGLGKRLVNEIVRRAPIAGFEKLCAFTHTPAFFVQMGFSIVPRAWMPEKIELDCRGCSQFRTCHQYAVVRPLARSRHGCVPLSSLHG
jgi:N-acetylglutamate synthase-like GNAT family acetyltransferase